MKKMIVVENCYTCRNYKSCCLWKELSKDDLRKTLHKDCPLPDYPVTLLTGDKEMDAKLNALVRVCQKTFGIGKDKT